MRTAIDMATMTPAVTPAAWMASDMADESKWVMQLSDDDVTQLEAALAHTKALGLSVPAITRDSFPVGNLAAKLAELRHRLEHGLGVVLLRGLPVARYSKMDAGTIYWGIGMHLGRPVAQNAAGDVLGHVWDLGRDPWKDVNSRGYQSNLRLGFHTDGADVVGLLCLRTAKAGGLSSIASSMAIHNAMLQEHPEALALLYQALPFDRRNEETADLAPFTTMRPFARHRGQLFNRTNRSFILSSQRFEDAPRLTPQDTAAMDLFDTYANDPRFHVHMELAPGDMQFLNNYVVLHSRTAYEDHEEIDRKRHLLRLWLFTPGLANTPADFIERNRLMDAWSVHPKPPSYDVNQVMGVTTH